MKYMICVILTIGLLSTAAYPQIGPSGSPTMYFAEVHGDLNIKAPDVKECDSDPACVQKLISTANNACKALGFGSGLPGQIDASNSKLKLVSLSCKVQ